MGTVSPLERDWTSRVGPTINGGGPALRLSAGLVAAPDPDDERTLSLIGRLDGTASRALRHLLRSMLRRCTPGMLITVDLSAVTTADVSGLSALIVIQRLAAARRCGADPARAVGRRDHGVGRAPPGRNLHRHPLVPPLAVDSAALHRHIPLVN